jgi:NADH:ubiquinone oxidoreductase subunit 6 (subunit J)
MAVDATKSVSTAISTYRYLRGGMVVIIAMLAAAILLSSLPNGCWQSSISAYYYTAVHNVFVAVLCCLGVMLIAYKASTDTEDVLLNLAGTLAFFVAFIPTTLPDTPHCQQILPTPEDKWNAIDNNFTAAIIALAIAVIVIGAVYLIDATARSQTSHWGNWLRVVSAFVIVGFILAFFVAPEKFEAAAHWVAAILVFVCIGAVVFLNAFLVTKQDEEGQDPGRLARYRNIYRVIAWAMVGTVVAAIVIGIAGGTGHLEGKSLNIPVFALETVLLLEFAVFWAVQTVELWNDTDRTALMTPETQEKLDRI